VYVLPLNLNGKGQVCPEVVPQVGGTCANNPATLRRRIRRFKKTMMDPEYIILVVSLKTN